MYMMPTEIVDRYTRRMDGTTEHRLDVLSALNDCLPTDIAELLELNGVSAPVDDISRARKLMDEGVTLTDAARTVGMSYNALRSSLYVRGMLLDGSRMDMKPEQARDMYAHGATDSEVARAYGVVPSTARLWRQKNGIGSSRERRKEIAACS